MLPSDFRRAKRLKDLPFNLCPAMGLRSTFLYLAAFLAVTTTLAATESQEYVPFHQ